MITNIYKSNHISLQNLKIILDSSGSSKLTKVPMPCCTKPPDFEVSVFNLNGISFNDGIKMA